MIIKTLQDIDDSTEEGRLLIAAIVKLSTESQTNKTPEEVLEQCKKLSSCDSILMQAYFM